MTPGWQPFQYNIYEGTSSGGESQVGSSSATNGTSFTVSSLASGTTYYFEVSTVYESCIDQPCLDSESARSTEASATTGFSVPRAPTELIASAAGSFQVRLSWTAPTAAAGAPVSGYKVYAGTSPGGESLADSSSATSDTVSSLSNGTRYYFEVTALNSAGESARSNEASATTDRAIQGLRSQIIRFGPLARHVVGVSITVSASASSGLPVSFRSDTPGLCSVSGSVVTAVKPGRCTITASQAGNADYTPAPDQTRSFQVGPGIPRASRAPVIVLAGVVLAAAAGALLVRRNRLRTRQLVKPSVRAEPHADSPGTVRLCVTSTGVTSTVRIEPHPAPVSSRLERPSHERH